MDGYDVRFPFSAVEGQRKVKRGMMLAVVNPRIGGILVSGEKGTAKSTLARGLARLLGGMPFVELPSGVTEDRLVGAFDLGQAIRHGVYGFEPGLLREVHGGILYSDDINLLPEQTLRTVLDVAVTGVNLVEREGVSYAHEASYCLIGTMNPEEGALRAHFLDRFGLYVHASGERDTEARSRIIARRLEYERNPEEFCARWEAADRRVADQISAGRRLLPKVEIASRELAYIAGLVKEGMCAGHRGELALCETARAVAALRNGDNVSPEDVEEAAAFALPHRLRQAVRIDRAWGEEGMRPRTQHDGEGDAPTPSERDGEAPNFGSDYRPDQRPPSAGRFGEDADEPANTVRPADIALRIMDPRGGVGAGTGRRADTISDFRYGRYARSCPRIDEDGDIAVDATIRAAVVRGLGSRRLAGGGASIDVKDDDIRIKVKERRTGMAILFLVDASGSMGARRRLGAVRGAALSLLSDAYKKRDQVGIVVFRGEGAETLLPFTRSIDLAAKKLMHLPTGGRTPLAAGLRHAREMMRARGIQTRQSSHFLVLVTDGRANVPEGSAHELAILEARRLAADQVHAVVLDTEGGFARFRLAEQIARELNAEHIPLASVTSAEVRSKINRYLR